ncbi:cellulase family glycosylhydrolase [Oscillospiraceae bacterium N12]|jgi:hypothetical protein|uniref:Cellulase family glycosylhydrolase n=1 Tax=Jilunia laotingensis TaxID=2763675 RepID=A0A926F6I0_9BACT|nr:glycoside hydrolase family 5 protein [Jilunia laotingensis]MBC8592780.1 cellulase family glycosylhydrolase [Jilunia laotingensis]
MKTVNLIFSVCIVCLLNLSAYAQDSTWSVEKAKSWGERQPWYCGVNYIPSNAINYTAMWDKTSFSPDLIDKELDLAEKIGINCVRVVMQYIVYEDDPVYFLRTFNHFLAISEKHHIKVIPCFFDDCAFGVNTDPVLGKQSEPLEGWYAWAWSPSPGYSMVVDSRTHYKLEEYVKSVMTRFKQDDRILLWDLYNEPTNTTMPERSLPLLYKVFEWAREINPEQPVTSGIWNDNTVLNDFLIKNSDVITFHRYAPVKETEEAMAKFMKLGRPVICTEWMNRVAKSTILDLLPLFKENHVGCVMWGLVNGKTQTHLSWGHRPEDLPYKGEWQHDIFTDKLVPYNPEEIELIKEMTRK